MDSDTRLTSSLSRSPVDSSQLLHMEFPAISFLTDGTISSATGNSSSALPRVVPQFLSFNVLG